MKNIDEIAKIIKEECKLKDNPNEKKMNMFFLIHEVILESKIYTTDFVAAFGHNLKEMLSYCCENNSNAQNLEALCGIINLWEKQKIYVNTFVDKLRKIISDKASLFGININFKQDLSGAKVTNNGSDSKHNKALIRDYKLVQENNVAKQMYEIKMLEEAYQKKQEELNKLFLYEDIHMALKNKNNQLEFEKAKEKLQLCKKLGTEIKELLMKILEEYCDCFKKCSKKCELEMKEWENFNYDSYEFYKQQIEVLRDQTK